MILNRTTSTPLHALDVVLCLALTIKLHGPEPKALRQTAVNLSRHAPYEHRPKLKKLASVLSDSKVLDAAWRMLDNTWEALGQGTQEPPNCHMKSMRPAAGIWYCQHCTHTKRRVL